MCRSLGGHRKGSRATPRNRRTIKRKFSGNQFTNKKNPKLTSSFAKKLRTSDEFIPPTDSSVKYVILCFNSVIFVFYHFTCLSKIIKCKECNGDVSFNQEKSRGLGFKICIECTCGRRFIESSPTIEKNCYEINQRLVLIMKILGIGFRGLKMFLALMDMPSNFFNSLYYATITKIHAASKQSFNILSQIIAAAGKKARILSVSGNKIG